MSGGSPAQGLARETVRGRTRQPEVATSPTWITGSVTERTDALFPYSSHTAVAGVDGVPKMTDSRGWESTFDLSPGRRRIEIVHGDGSVATTASLEVDVIAGMELVARTTPVEVRDGEGRTTERRHFLIEDGDGAILAEVTATHRREY